MIDADNDNNVRIQEYRALVNDLREHHAIFYKLADISRPIFTTNSKTADVSFDRDGRFLNLSFNPDYWDSLTPYEAKFLICHEMLHLVLCHGSKMAQLKTENNRKCFNVVADVVINESLVSNFGFDRSRLSMSEQLCWLDTVFPKGDVEPDRSVDYYYSKLPTIAVGCPDPSELHGEIPVEDFIGEKEIGELLDSAEASDEEAQKLTEALADHSYGTVAKGDFYKAKAATRIRDSWKRVVRRWSKQFRQSLINIDYTWRTRARRMYLMPQEFFIPSSELTETEKSRSEDDMVHVFVYFDTSYSCYDHIDDFYEAVLSLDPDVFCVQVYTFDTAVYPFDAKSGEAQGLGGTNFQVIEDHVKQTLSELKNKKDGPKDHPYVFVLTDGYAPCPNVSRPDKWKWFLTTSKAVGVPPECDRFMLSDFL